MNIVPFRIIKLFVSYQTVLGKSFWKRNVKILQDQQLTYDIEAFYQTKHPTEATSSWWEKAKTKIGNVLIRQ